MLIETLLIVLAYGVVFLLLPGLTLYAILSSRAFPILCKDCGYEGKPKYGRNKIYELGLFFLGIFPVFIYHCLTPRWVCPNCKGKNVQKKNNKRMQCRV